MTTISLCMIVKNEEDVLERCLKSVREAVDEIIVVDTGSTDATPFIAERCGARLHSFAWVDDFSAARNFAFSKATCQYIMWLDADDIVKPDDLEKLIELKAQLDGSVRQVAAKYNVAFDEHGNVTLSYYRERLFLRAAGFVWQGEVHEVIPLEGTALYSDFAVTHAKVHPTEKGRNLRILEKQLSTGKSFSAREQYYYARELYYNGLFEQGEKAFEEFLRGDGRPQDKIGACVLLAKCRAAFRADSAVLAAYFESFEYGRPCAEICCGIGDVFFGRQDYAAASFWYSAALSDSADLKSGAFVNLDFYNYIPLLQLCVCSDRLGKKIEAESYNELAAGFKPESEAVRYNREYFAAQKKENG